MAYPPILSRIGTETSKDFRMMPMPQSAQTQPTGVWGYRRVSLASLLPQLGNITLDRYYLLRIACCGHLLVAGEDTLQSCPRCMHNQGFVCPWCLGAGIVSAQGYPGNQMPCTRCRYKVLGDDHKTVIWLHDPERELQAAQTWLMQRFPMGVPPQPTPLELKRMDTLRYISAGGV